MDSAEFRRLDYRSAGERERRGHDQHHGRRKYGSGQERDGRRRGTASDRQSGRARCDDDDVIVDHVLELH
jgi:hypothetical protein